MAYILHIETATDICSVALAQDGMLIKEMRANEARQHISHLSTLIDDLLSASGIEYNALSAIAVSAGPGSYTGLRVGYATAKGLCLSIDIPLITVNTLYSLAWSMKNHMKEPTSIDRYIPMIDARRMEVYAAVFDGGLQELKPAHALILDERCIQEWRDRELSYAFAGNGAHKVFDILPEVSNYKYFIINDLYCDSRALVSSAWDKYKKHDFADLAYDEPLYIKPPNITKSKKANPFA